MTNTELLAAAISRSGYLLSHIAQCMGLSRQGLNNKLTGRTEFTQSEIITLSRLLSLTKIERERIFFAAKVDK